jgi:hypothetical protein
MTIRNVVLALLGAAVLVLVPAYDGPFETVLGSYGGNVAVSFALYFAALNATARYRRARLLAASATLVAVELFEASDGFGVMANTFDPIDFVANAAGVGLAVLVDVVTTPILRRHGERTPGGHGATPT